MRDMKPMRLLIVLEGGQVQGVSSPDGEMYPLEIVCVDYDTEAADEYVLTEVDQGGGRKEEAFVWRQKVGELRIPWPEL